MTSTLYEYQVREVGGEHQYYKRPKGEKVWSFTTEEDFTNNSSPENSIIWQPELGEKSNIEDDLNKAYKHRDKLAEKWAIAYGMRDTEGARAVEQELTLIGVSIQQLERQLSGQEEEVQKPAFEGGGEISDSMKDELLKEAAEYLEGERQQEEDLGRFPLKSDLQLKLEGASMIMAKGGNTPKRHELVGLYANPAGNFLRAYPYGAGYYLNIRSPEGKTGRFGATTTKQLMEFANEEGFDLTKKMEHGGEAEGGQVYGKTHDQGGETFTVGSSGNPVELEGAGVVKDESGKLKAIDGGEGV